MISEWKQPSNTNTSAGYVGSKVTPAFRTVNIRHVDPERLVITQNQGLLSYQAESPIHFTQHRAGFRGVSHSCLSRRRTHSNPLPAGEGDLMTLPLKMEGTHEIVYWCPVSIEGPACIESQRTLERPGPRSGRGLAPLTGAGFSGLPQQV